MSEQTVLTWMAISAALAYVLAATWRTWFSARQVRGCGRGCGSCRSATEPSSPEDTRRIPLATLGAPRVMQDGSRSLASSS